MLWPLVKEWLGLIRYLLCQSHWWLVSLHGPLGRTHTSLQQNSSQRTLFLSPFHASPGLSRMKSILVIFSLLTPPSYVFFFFQKLSSTMTGYQFQLSVSFYAQPSCRHHFLDLLPMLNVQHLKVCLISFFWRPLPPVLHSLFSAPCTWKQSADLTCGSCEIALKFKLCFHGYLLVRLSEDKDLLSDLPPTSFIYLSN